jgi:hypothetical protein
MAKKRARGVGRELSRAEQKALERRAAVSAPVVPRAAVAEPPLDASPTVTSGARRGVLPPRTAGIVRGGPTITREQELAYIRGDLRRMVILSAAMLAVIIVISIILP